MSLTTARLRPDWRLIEEQDRAFATRWRAHLQVILILCGLVALVPAAVSAPNSGGTQSLFGFAARITFAATFIVLPVWLYAGRRGARPKAIGLVFIASTAAAALAFFSTPRPYNDLGYGVSVLPPLTAIGIPLLMAAVLMGAESWQPGLLRGLGLVGRRWERQVITGLAAGLALGLHFWAAAAVMPDWPQPQLPAPTQMLYLLAVTAGFRALGEEMALRGALYRLLSGDESLSRALLALRMVILGLPLYIIPTIQLPTLSMKLFAITYGILFTLVATYLRMRSTSLIPTLAANLAFNVMVSAAEAAWLL